MTDPHAADPHAADAPTNRLAGESSPYLLLHRTNPVDWYPWGDEALARAREEDRPIFLSVGYSTCYWCHVMERESFSDPETAELMNRHFVNIKVDREERPDIDEIYMVATQILTGQGGWPNSVFLTPDLKPFFAGTYFPPEDRYGRPSFRSVVRGLAEAWQSRRGEIAEQSDDMAAEMQKALEGRFYPGDAPAPPKTALAAASSLERRFDREWGGFSQAPKFPTPSNLYLLQELAGGPAEEGGGGDEAAAEMLRVTLDRMARGGIYDQLAGGFHRYATDREWRIPHFEKMLYDNGFLLELYAREHARTGEPEHARIVRETAAFLEREMTSPEGAFYSAIDAETDGHEGAYYVWTREELNAALGEEDAVFLAPILGFDRPPFFENHHYVLHLARPVAEQAEERRMSRKELLGEIRPLEDRLLAVRDGRDRPATDDKVLTDWNGIAIAGLATAGRLLGDGGMVEQAARAARFLLRELRPEGGTLLHSWRGGQARIPAYLADYAFLIRGLLALDAARPDDGWLSAAEELAAEQERRLWDPEQGAYFVAEAAPDLLFRSKDVFDGAVPSANAVAALNLLELGDRTGKEAYRRSAEEVLRAFAPVAEKYAEGVKMLTVAAWRFGGGEAGLREEGGPVEAAATAGTPGLEAEAESVVTSVLEVGPAADGWRPFTVRLTLAPGWHVQANPASAPELVATRVEARDGELRGVDYPEGESFPGGFAGDEAQGAALQVYGGTVEIRGEMTQGARLALVYQACDESRCLPEVRRALAEG